MNINEYIKKWKKDYHIREDVGESLKDAREKGLLLYKNDCKIHGKMLFYTNDQFCPCCAKEARDKRRKVNRIFERSRGLFNEIKKRSKENDIIFNISKNDLREIYGVVKTCPILGLDIDYIGDGTSGPKDDSPSIDRLIPDLGYEKDNINILSQRANRLKSDGSAEEHILVGLWIMKKSGRDNEYISNLIRKLQKEGE